MNNAAVRVEVQISLCDSDFKGIVGSYVLFVNSGGNSMLFSIVAAPI